MKSRVFATVFGGCAGALLLSTTPSVHAEEVDDLFWDGKYYSAAGCGTYQSGASLRAGKGGRVLNFSSKSAIDVNCPAELDRVAAQPVDQLNSEITVDLYVTRGEGSEAMSCQITLRRVDPENTVSPLIQTKQVTAFGSQKVSFKLDGLNLLLNPSTLTIGCKLPKRVGTATTGLSSIDAYFVKEGIGG